MRVTGILTFTIGAVCAALFAASSQSAVERVDELVQAASRLDVDPKRGREIFRRHCVSCHGVAAQGDASRGIPSLAASFRPSFP